MPDADIGKKNGGGTLFTERPYDMQNIYQFMETREIQYERYDHPPVYTVEDVKRLTPDLPGSKTKNLFLRDAKGRRHFLVIVPHDKRVDLKALGKATGVGRISFGSPKRLMKYLGVEPGSVSLLAIFNDGENNVEVFMDKSLWQASAFQFHPLVNTSTLVISKENIEKIIEATGHKMKIIEVPARD